MRKIVVLCALIVLSFTGCMKEKGCKTVDPETEVDQILSFAAFNGIDSIIKHNSGIYYKVLAPGYGANPTATSWVSVNYTGKLLNGSQFDKSSSPVGFSLTNVIEGWQIGIPLIKKGGKILLFIPSAYAYGCNGGNTIPPNAVLYFEVDLINVQ